MSDTKDSGVRTIEIALNGERQALAAGSVAALLKARGIDPAGRGLAVALNGAVVPRAAWAGTALKSGDAVEIVQAKQGG